MQGEAFRDVASEQMMRNVYDRLRGGDEVRRGQEPQTPRQRRQRN